MTPLRRQAHVASPLLKENFRSLVCEAFRGFMHLWRTQDPVTTTVVLPLTLAEFQELGLPYIANVISGHVERNREGRMRFAWKIQWPHAKTTADPAYKLVFKIELI
jgi:hypothetical protein